MRQVVRISSLLILVAATGCKTTSYNPTFFGGGQGYNNGYGVQQGMGVGVGNNVPAQGAMGQVQLADRALRGQNYTPVSALMQADLNERQLTSFPFMAQPGFCYGTFAVSDGNAKEIDMTIANPSGTVVVHENDSGTHPSGSFCASEFGMHFARLTMLSGTGRVYFGIYQGPQNTTVNLASVFDSNVETIAQLNDGPDTDTAARIAAFRAQLEGQGYQIAQDVKGYTMRSGQPVHWPAQLYQGWCYSFATFAGPGAQNSDLVLTNATGSRRVAADNDRNPDAALREICPETTQGFQLRPKITGQGSVWFIAMARRNQTAPPPQDTSVPQTSSNAVAISTQLTVQNNNADGVSRNLERDWLAIGYASAGDSQGSAMTPNSQVEYAYDLQTNNCYAFAAAGVDSVQELDLSLVGPNGAVVDRYLGRDARPNIRVCPTTAGRYTARLRMAQGEGAVRVSLFRWTEGTSGAGMSGLMFVRTAEITRLLRADGYSGDSSIDPYRGEIREGNTVTRNLSLENNTCYAMVAVGGDGVSGLEVKVQKGTTTVGREESYAAFPASRFCTRASGQHRVEIKSVSGSGPVSFRVYRRQASGG